MSEKNDLEHEAFKALAGADGALAHLLSSMSFGEENVNTFGYAVKYRIKNADSLANKVRSKRSNPNKAEYSIGSVTDIIGVRILCLWPNDLIEAALWLVRFLERKTSLEIDAVFDGPSIDDAIDEVIVYAAQTSTEPVYKECYVRLRASFADILGNKIKLMPPEPDKNYSSIHIVANLRHYSAGKPRTYKVEFQVRTALEDVWAEMDHKLFYKGDESSNGRPEVALGRRMMLMQKQFVDATSVTTDDIRQACQSAAAGPLSERYIRAIGVEVSEERAGLEKSSNRTKEAFSRLQMKMAEIYEKLDNQLRENKLDISSRLITDFASVVSELEQFYALSMEPEAGQVEVDKVNFFVQMERALATFWIARLHKAGAPQSDFGNGSRSSQSMAERLAITRCLEIYTELSADQRYKRDAFLWFRLSQAQLELAEDPDAAAKAITVSVALLPEDPNFPERSQFRMVIPRMADFFRWMEYDRYSVEELKGNVLSDNAKNMLLGIINNASQLLDLDIEDGTTRGSFDPGFEKAKTLNNLVVYVTKFIETGGSWQDLAEAGLTEASFKKRLKELDENFRDRLDSLPWAVHTLMIAYRLLRDAKAKDLAIRLIRSLDEGHGKDADDRLWSSTMRKDAQDIIGG